MADTTEKTIASELREAAARAREHLLSHVVAEVLPQTAIVVLCGSVHEESAVTCRNCVLFDVKDRVLARLVATLINAREPLASWLEQVAEVFDKEVICDQPECPACGDGCHVDHGTLLVHDGGCGGVLLDVGEDRCSCFAGGMAVARVLNGTSR
ncbi:hypothetical protein FXF51_05870 [Nonomuraea sp. PA05]|uniref:hypothetical protein n=1 Tax=Nonomuraea sp. PA05 TaxID=2604466 RepID=UPI0011DABDAD|nr:hypothetical protein [Nonomuraea sp. PA05]TYB69687.1 hypothetical protein FXF51_05870 [Nonomuraea sp. PA05]